MNQIDATLEGARRRRIQRGLRPQVGGRQTAQKHHGQPETECHGDKEDTGEELVQHVPISSFRIGGAVSRLLLQTFEVTDRIRV